MYINENNIIKNSNKLKKNGFLRISNFLEVDYAASIYKCLTDDFKWDLACRIDSDPKTFRDTASMEELATIDRKKLIGQMKEEFQFIYNSYMMVTAYIEKRNPDLYLDRVLEWLNSEHTKAFFSLLTQNQSIVKINAQATRYMPGHFLTQHNDEDIEEGRLYAYVIGLSKNWNPDWGGLLHILDEKGKIVETLIPEYNSLSIFKVPQNHFVSMVTPSAQNPRLGITGWLLSK